MLITPSQCRAGRALIDWTQPELAKASGLGISTVVDFERERRRVSDDAVSAMRSALERKGVEFTNGKRPGVRLKIK
jgi:transcriptional regulator with XRE-family HTH domain